MFNFDIGTFVKKKMFRQSFLLLFIYQMALSQSDMTSGYDMLDKGFAKAEKFYPNEYGLGLNSSEAYLWNELPFCSVVYIKTSCYFLTLTTILGYSCTLLTLSVN